MAEWTDKTSFSRGDTDRTPRTWEIRLGNLVLIVTRHIHYGPDTWVGTCRPFFEQRELASSKIDEAKCQAKAMVQVELEKALKDILA